MKFNISLDKEQIDEIASITADKVLSTVQYCRDNEMWYEREIEDLRRKVSVRDGMLVNKNLYIEKLREDKKRLREKIKELEAEIIQKK